MKNGKSFGSQESARRQRSDQKPLARKGGTPAFLSRCFCLRWEVTIDTDGATYRVKKLKKNLRQNFSIKGPQEEKKSGTSGTTKEGS